LRETDYPFTLFLFTPTAQKATAKMATPNKNTPAVIETKEAAASTSDNNNTELQPIEEGFYGVELTQEIAEATMAALANLPNMNRGIEITAEYHKFETEGENIRGIYAGQQRIFPTKGGTTKETNSRVGDDGKIAAAKMMIATPDGPKMIIMADAVIVSTLESFRPATPISITFKGTKDGKNGRYNQYSIEQLFAGK
jgi:hypothetical protein